MNQLNHKTMLNMIQFCKRDDDGLSLLNAVFPFHLAQSTVEATLKSEEKLCIQENDEE